LVPGENVNYDEDFSVDEVGLTSKQGRLLQISARLDLDNTVSVSCAGAIMSYLQRRRASEYLQDDPAAQLAYRVSHVEMFTFKDTMCGP
jgi:DNA mismatch repair protein MSH5